MDNNTRPEHDENHGATVGIGIIVLFLIVGAIGMFVKKPETETNVPEDTSTNVEETIPQS